MKTELNNTGILLADLNDTEIKLAIELYKLKYNKSNQLVLEDDEAFVGVLGGCLGFWWDNKGLIKITLHQLAFESGLNPDWANEVCIAGGFLMWSNGRSYQFISSERFNLDEQVIIKKQTQEWPDESSLAANRFADIGDDNKMAKDLESCCDIKEAHGGNYDIITQGKYGTGHNIIDCYRIFSALEAHGMRMPAEIEHAFKKIMFAGTRGAKDQSQDYREAVKSINCYLERIK